MKLLGSNFVLLVERSGSMIPVCCGRELSIEITSDILEATKAPGSKWRSYYYGNKSWSLQTSGLVDIGDGYGVHDVYDALANDKILTFVAMSQQENSIFYSGKMLTQSVSIIGNNRDAMQYRFSATGDGPLSIENPYQIEVMTDEFGNVITDENGAVIYSQVNGDLPPIDLSVNC